MTAPAVTLDHVSCWYGDMPVLRDISLVAPGGVITALIGPADAGKSTLLRLVNRLAEEEPGFRVEGRVAVGESDVYDDDVDRYALRRRVGMVFRKPALLPGSLFDNVAFGALVAGASATDAAAAVESAMRRVDLWGALSGRLDADPRALSRAEQQLLCVARALAVSPDVLLLDTPTRSLDRAATSQLEDALRALAGACTVLIATDDVQQAGRLAHTTAFVAIGALVESGLTEIMFTRPKKAATEAWLSRRYV